ncbi:MAG: hypothetical protein V4622_10495 [Bacteroidota bacterium]
MNDQVPQQIELEYATIRLIEDQIVEDSVKHGTVIDFNEVLEIKSANIKLTQGKKYVILIDAEDFLSVTKDARELLSSREFAGNSIAKALLITSFAQKILANFYITVHKPYISTQAFTDREEAIIWLRIQLNEYQNK